MSLGVEYGAVGIVKNFGEYSIRTVRGTQSFDCEAAYSKEDVKDYPIAKDTFADKEVSYKKQPDWTEPANTEFIVPL